MNIFNKDEDNFNKFFKEMISNFEYKKLKDINNMKAKRYLEFCNDLNTELLNSIQEINIIIKNSLMCRDEYFDIPFDVNNLLVSLYKKSSDFNNYMLDLAVKDTFVDLPEEDDEQY